MECDTLEVDADRSVTVRLRTALTDSFVNHLPAAR